MGLLNRARAAAIAVAAVWLAGCGIGGGGKVADQLAQASLQSRSSTPADRALAAAAAPKFIEAFGKALNEDYDSHELLQRLAATAARPQTGSSMTDMLDASEGKKLQATWSAARQQAALAEPHPRDLRGVMILGAAVILEEEADAAKPERLETLLARAAGFDRAVVARWAGALAKLKGQEVEPILVDAAFLLIRRDDLHGAAGFDRALSETRLARLAQVKPEAVDAWATAAGLGYDDAAMAIVAVDGLFDAKGFKVKAFEAALDGARKKVWARNGSPDLAGSWSFSLTGNPMHGDDSGTLALKRTAKADNGGFSTFKSPPTYLKRHAPAPGAPLSPEPPKPWIVAVRGKTVVACLELCVAACAGEVAASGEIVAPCFVQMRTTGDGRIGELRLTRATAAAAAS